MSDKPTSSEEEFFAREQAEKLRKLALENSKKMAEEDRQKLKDLHWMHCPKCGTEMGTIQFRNIELERCGYCGYTGLDDGELEKIAGADGGGSVMKSVLNIFKGK